MNANITHADCLEWMRTQPADCMSLTMCSPPYEAARTYGIDFTLKGQDWVDWAKERFLECLRITSGLVCWVVEGQTRQFRYSAAPILLMADLHRAGVHLRKPPAFHRVGIPGSGGPDWLRNDYEFCVCGTKGGKLPWSDNTAMGHPPKWAPGGEMSYRISNGARVNQWGMTEGHSKESGKDGAFNSRKPRPSHRRTFSDKVANGAKVHTKADPDGMREQAYLPPTLANPGNVIKVIVGGGLMGSALAHENEAPFPEALAEFFIRSFCEPGGTVFDPFSGSGTTAAVALRTGRKFVGTDIRESQVELTKRRIAEVQRELFV